MCITINKTFDDYKIPRKKYEKKWVKGLFEPDFIHYSDSNARRL